MCPLSAGCSSRYSAPESRAARSKDVFALMLWRHVWESRDVIPVTDRRRPTVGRVTREESAD
eukprot:1947999-Pleurochrysis_carterae.AAC.1